MATVDQRRWEARPVASIAGFVRRNLCVCDYPSRLPSAPVSGESGAMKISHRLSVAFGLVAAVLGVTGTQAQAAESLRVLDHGDIEWVRHPTGREVANYYPDAAAQRGVSGWGVAACRVRDNGTLGPCRLAAEAPEGWRFGDAVVAMSPRFKIKPTNRSGEAVGGALMLLQVVLQKSAGAAPRPTAAPGSPALVLQPLPAGAREGRGRVQCRTTEGQGLCSLHDVHWERRPRFEEAAPLIRMAEPRASLMECVIGEDGALTACQLPDGQPEVVRAGTIKLAERYLAPSQTADGKATGLQKVIVTFDWPTLKKVLAALEGVAGGN